MSGRLKSPAGRRRLIACALVAVMAAPAQAQLQDENLVRALLAPAQRAEAGEWGLAGQALVSLAQSLPSQDAAAAFAAAAYCFEQSNDSQAYAAWSQALVKVLEAGTNWDTLRERIGRQADEQAQALALSGRPSGAPPPLIELLGIIPLRQFSGPRPGLGAQTDERTINVVRKHFAKPPGHDDGSNLEAFRSRDAAAVAEQQPAAPVSPVIHGALAVAARNRGSNGAAASAQTPAENRGPEVFRAVSRGLDRVITDLSREQIAAAQAAWRYFEINVSQRTGLVSPVRDYPYTTMWDVGSGIAALTSAGALGLVSPNAFRERSQRMLDTLEQLPLYDEALPNREYDTTTGSMVNAQGEVAAIGSGWSAIDIGRVLLWLKILQAYSPDQAAQIDRIVGRWALHRAVSNGLLTGATLRRNRLETYPDGRLGPRQYAAAGFAIWGQPVGASLALPAQTQRPETADTPIPFDPQQPDTALTSDAFYLSLLEMGGITGEMASASRQVYAAQRSHPAAADGLVALGEDSTDSPPWFMLNALVHRGEWWVSLDHQEQRLAQQQLVSTKALFAWSALFDDDYANKLRAARSQFVRKDGDGFLAGRYADGSMNRSFNINTHAVILQALWYEARGRIPFLRLEAEERSLTRPASLDRR